MGLLPDTRYATDGSMHLAYQVVGSGERDVLFVPWFQNHLEVQWEEPRIARFLTSLASFSRLILFDQRGTGMSDPVLPTQLPTLDTWITDVQIVMNAVGTKRVALVAHSGGGFLAMLFAATHPESVSHLVLMEPYARMMRSDDYPWGAPPQWLKSFERVIEHDWGTGKAIIPAAPSLAGDTEFIRWFGRFERMASSPGVALALVRMVASADIRSILPTIATPTLILHRAGNQIIRRGHAVFIAESIPGAKRIELAGNDHPFFVGATEKILSEIEQFVLGTQAGAATERVLTTLVFGDIVRSTGLVAASGDDAWKHALDQHDALVSRHVARFGGKYVKNTGDGFLAMFDGPARAVHCAVSVRDALRSLGLRTRLGVHTTEVEKRGDDVSGIGVHVAARIMAVAEADEVLVSATVSDLIAGSGIHLRDRGRRKLKGTDRVWRLSMVSD